MTPKHRRLAFLLAIVSILLLTAFVGCVPEGNDPIDSETNEASTSQALSTVPEENRYIALSVSPVSVAMKNNAATLTQTLTATVQPPTTENKAVDWTVAWADGSHTDPVTDYVTVTPDGDGSAVATVTCYQPFTGDVIITVITRDGGYSARCICNYVGNPTSLKIEPTGASVVSDKDWGVRIAEVKSGNVYSFDLLPSNVFGSTNTSFAPEYTISIQAHGGIKTVQNNYDKGGSLTATLNKTVDLTVADLMDSEGYCYAYFPKTGGLHVFTDFRIENGKLKVEAKQDPASYTWTTGSPAGKAISRFDGYVDAKQPYVTVTVTEKNTGITQVIHIRCISAVNGVTLSRDRMSF